MRKKRDQMLLQHTYLLLLPCASWLWTLAVADADFASVRTALTKDYSGKGGDSKQKFFRKLMAFCIV